jgi:hypothetical protein
MQRELISRYIGEFVRSTPNVAPPCAHAHARSGFCPVSLRNIRFELCASNSTVQLMIVGACGYKGQPTFDVSYVLSQYIFVLYGRLRVYFQEPV